MLKLLQQFKADTYLPHPEHGGVFVLGDDELIYLIAGSSQSYWIERLQPIRKELAFEEVVLWEQFVRTGHEAPPGPRGGRMTFTSLKKALASLEAGEVEWVPSPYDRTDSDRQAAYDERSSNDYLPSKVKWALTKGKSDEWVCKRAGLVSLERPWQVSPCPLIPLVPRS